MSQTLKRRRVQKREKQRDTVSLWESLRVEENFQAFLDSRAWARVCEGVPEMAAALCVSVGTLAGGAMPFGSAYLGGSMMRGKRVEWAAAGCMVGCLIRKRVDMLLVCALLLILYRCFRAAELRPNDLTCVLAAGGLAGILPLLFAKDAYDGMLAGMSAVCVLLLSRMYAQALRLRGAGRTLLTVEETISLVMLGASIAAGLRGVALWGVVPAQAALYATVMGTAYLGGAGLGAACGGVCGLLLGITSPSSPDMMLSMALTGLLCGLFGRQGRVWTAAAVPLAAILTTALDVRFLTIPRGVELLLGVVVFLCIPKRVWESLRAHLDRQAALRKEAELTQEGLRQDVGGQLAEYAALYGRMADTMPSGGQFAAVSEALDSMARELRAPVLPLPDLSASIAQELDKAGIRAESVQAQTVNDALRVRLCVHCKRRDGLCDGRMVQCISRAAGRTMHVLPTGVCPKEGACRLELEAAHPYALHIGSAAASGRKGDPSGDTLTTVQLPDGKYLLAISDGMGHGEEAMRESRAAVERMEDYLLARFEPEAALHGVNECLLRTLSGECFATMDVMLVDLKGGLMRAMKIGAASSYVIRGRRIIEVSGDALPMGVVERVQPSVTSIQLQDGDVLVLVSDGIPDAVGGDEKWMQQALLAIDARDPDGSAQKLLYDALRVDRRRDDMTVCVARVMLRP